MNPPQQQERPASPWQQAPGWLKAALAALVLLAGSLGWHQWPWVSRGMLIAAGLLLGAASVLSLPHWRRGGGSGPGRAG